MAQAVARLESVRIDNPKLDARLLLEAATGLDRAALLLKQGEEMEPAALLVFASLIERRLAREPVGRILGVREFYGLPFRLNAGTLEPRPDSETLIEAVLHELDDRQVAYRILDLGTGTGCLLAALLSVLPRASGIGIDKNPLAVEAARGNLAELGLEDRSEIIEQDWNNLSNVMPAWSQPALGGIHVNAGAGCEMDPSLRWGDNSFDIIISNPPYIRADEMSGLEPEVTRHDPELALVAGDDGLQAYRAIVAALPGLLKPQGIAVLELGAGQAAAVGDLATRQELEVAAIRRDLGRIERAIVLKSK